MKNRLLFGWILLGLLLSACSNEADDSIVKKVPITYNFTRGKMLVLSKNYVYDSQNRLSEIIEGNGDLNTKFFYEGNQLSQIVIEDNATGNVQAKYFEENDDRILIKPTPDKVSPGDTIYLNNNGFPERFITRNGYESYFYDSNGRLAKREFYSNQENVYSILYEYDNKPGIFSCVDLPVWYMIIYMAENNYVNNVMKITTVCPACNTIDPVYTYTYDANGYPVSYASDIDDEIGTFTYRVK